EPLPQPEDDRVPPAERLSEARHPFARGACRGARVRDGAGRRRSHTEPVKYALALLLVAVCGCGGSGASTWQVHSDGRIGPLRIDISTEAQIRKFAGRPYKVQGELWPEKQGRTLYYRCGRHCETTYSISK